MNSIKIVLQDFEKQKKREFQRLHCKHYSDVRDLEEQFSSQESQMQNEHEREIDILVKRDIAETGSLTKKNE